MPRAAVLGAHDREATRPQHAIDLRQEQVDARDVLDDLIRVDEIERGIGPRQLAVEIRLLDADTTTARELRAIRDDFDSADVGAVQSVGDCHGPAPVVATEVEHARDAAELVARCRGEPQDVLAVQPIGLIEQGPIQFREHALHLVASRARPRHAGSRARASPR